MPKNTWSNYKRSGIWVDPPPCFFKIPTFSRFFWQTSLIASVQLNWQSPEINGASGRQKLRFSAYYRTKLRWLQQKSAPFLVMTFSKSQILVNIESMSTCCEWKAKYMAFSLLHMCFQTELFLLSYFLFHMSARSDFEAANVPKR